MPESSARPAGDLDQIREPRITKANVQAVYDDAMLRDDARQLAAVFSFLQGHGWSGFISPDDAIAALASSGGEQEEAQSSAIGKREWSRSSSER